MKVLVVNAGSSSLKYQLIDMDGEKTLASGLVERIGNAGDGQIKQKIDGETVYQEAKIDIKDHVVACHLMLAALTNEQYGVVKNMSEIGAVGHRVLHGGSKFTESVIIDEKVMDAIAENIILSITASGYYEYRIVCHHHVESRHFLPIA